MFVPSLARNLLFTDAEVDLKCGLITLSSRNQSMDTITDGELCGLMFDYSVETNGAKAAAPPWPWASITVSPKPSSQITRWTERCNYGPTPFLPELGWKRRNRSWSDKSDAEKKRSSFSHLLAHVVCVFEFTNMSFFFFFVWEPQGQKTQPLILIKLSSWQHHRMGFSSCRHRQRPSPLLLRAQFEGRFDKRKTSQTNLSASLNSQTHKRGEINKHEVEE